RGRHPRSPAPHRARAPTVRTRRAQNHPPADSHARGQRVPPGPGGPERPEWGPSGARPPPAAGTEPALRMASASGRWVLFATVLGSAMAAIDATVVGLALPAIGQEFHAILVVLQWVACALSLTRPDLTIVAGSLV